MYMGDMSIQHVRTKHKITAHARTAHEGSAASSAGPDVRERKSKGKSAILTVTSQCGFLAEPAHGHDIPTRSPLSHCAGGSAWVTPQRPNSDALARGLLSRGSRERKGGQLTERCPRGTHLATR